MRVRLPFQPRWRPAVLAGTKTTTVRTKRHGSAGDEFEVEGQAFTLVATEHTSLADACAKWWREEGMTSPEEFVTTWTSNHPTRGYRPDDAVWVHRFVRAPDSTREPRDDSPR